MRRLFGIVILLSFCLNSLHARPKPTRIVVATYNIRYINRDDSIHGNGWAQRSPWLARLVYAHGFEIFGTQEGFKRQLDDLKALLPGYDYFGLGREDGKEAGEHSAIFYRTDLFKVIRHGDFWLSETTDRPSLGWDAACIRICTWGHFKHIPSGREFLFFSLHMDHVGKKARMESTRLVMEKMKEFGDKLPAILVGDFNVDQNSDEYRDIVSSGVFNDAYQSAKFRYAPNGTFNDFKPAGFTTSRIDHIFISPSIDVDKYTILTDTYRSRPKGQADTPVDPYSIRVLPYVARTPSDHYPVRAELLFALSYSFSRFSISRSLSDRLTISNRMAHIPTEPTTLPIKVNTASGKAIS